MFRLEEETHGVKGVGDFKCGESDRKFGTKEELARYMHELLEREKTSVEPLDILERTAFDHLGENAFKVRTREERGIWQRTCPRCNGKRIETCPGCDGAKRFQCDACNGKGQFDCPTCNGEREVPCLSCGGFGSNSCGWCGGTGEMYSESEGRYVSCSACGGGRSCRRCNGTGKVDCSTCGHSGKVPCRSCGGRGWVKCSTCNGVGTVPCRRCAATGVLHELVFIESVARKREITFCKDFLPDVPLPVMTLAGIFRDDGSREVALYAECRIAICTFTVIGPKGEQIPLTVWGERHRLTGNVGELQFPDIDAIFLVFSAATIEKCGTELAGFTFLKKGFTPHFVEIASAFFHAPFLAKAIGNSELCAANEKLALCRARFIAAIKNLSWRYTLPLLLVEILILAPLLPLQDTWLDSIRRLFKTDPFSNPLALPYLAATLFGVFIGFLCLLTKDLLRQNIIGRIGGDTAAVQSLFNAEKLGRLNFWQNCLLLFVAVLCSGGVAFVYFFREEIPVWWGHIKAQAVAAWAYFRENVPVWWAQVKSVLTAAWDSCAEKLPGVLEQIQSLLQRVWEYCKELGRQLLGWISHL